MLEKITAFFMAIINFFMSLFGLGQAGGQQYNCQTFFDLSYGTHERQVVDLFVPENASGDLGLVLFIHGGAWIQGDKESYKGGMEYGATNLGIATASVNYRYISDDVDLLDVLDDIDSALAKVKAKGAEVGVNINKVLLTGDSAGGHLSLLYAYARKKTAPIAPVAVISNSGPTDLYDDNFYHNNALGNEAVISDLMSKACGQRFAYEAKESAKAALYSVSPISYVSSDCVPTVINHGTADTIVPFSNAQTLDALLTQHGVEHVLNVYDGADHDLGKDEDAKDRADELLFGYIDRFLK
ncbi:MAG: alpha/beta hydrolase [Ruminococcaceae bacterium]|nr:alpha/beta hydrolase [Oscillospiraceae bacterium]MBQ6874538.1 alpha/beta hydrolase [Clostridia bacterium]